MADQQQMALDFDGLIQLLAKNLYAEKKVFIRELIQNAHDAIVRRAQEETDFTLDQGHIDITTDLSAGGRIIFRDNGVGMSRQDLEEFLSTVGRSGTKAARDRAKESEAEELEVIGQFGIGFLSGFVVADRIEVKTRRWNLTADQGCLWSNAGRIDYSIEPLTLERPGTEVVVHLASAADFGLIQEDAVRKLVRDYADMLRVAIHVNDPQHRQDSVNARFMPWEKPGASAEDIKLDAFVFLARTVPDSVLEVIPVKLHEPATDDEPEVHAEGLLYITRTRVLGRDAPRTVRLFLKRMFLCEDAKDILPHWASFVNGVINSRSLTPNAARDNFARDRQATRLRDRLGDLILAHLEGLKTSDPERLSKIIDYHDFGIKGACFHYPAFFDRFAPMLEWRINPGAGIGQQRGDEAGAAWARLPELIAATPAAPGALTRLAYFSTRTAANQFFDMADAARSLVIDVSRPFELDLLKRWAERPNNRLELVAVDREDDPAVFLPLDPAGDHAVERLARRMSEGIQTRGGGQVRVSAKRFAPATLPAVIKAPDDAGGAHKARDILNDPDAPADLRRMAEDLLRLNRNKGLRMVINAHNPLICRLAALIDSHGAQHREELDDLTLGVYNDAILYNQELMTPGNAKIFHEQFQRMMDRALEFVAQKTDLEQERAALQQQAQAQRPRAQAPGARKVAFLMTPFKPEFEPVRTALRTVIETYFGCALATADERTFHDFIHSNVKEHLDRADFYIADVTGANPNVMLELGAAIYGAPLAPTLLITQAVEGGDLDLPADLHGRIACRYDLSSGVDRLAAHFETHFLRYEKLKPLLPPQALNRPVPLDQLRAWMGTQRRVTLLETSLAALAGAFPDLRAWRNATPASVAARLDPEDVDLAPFILRHLQAQLAAAPQG